MKRVLLIIGSIVAVVAVTITFVGSYVINTPEYALMEIIEDVNASGIDGLRPHLTEDAQKAVDTVSSVAGSKFVGSIMQLFNKDDYVSILKSEIQEIQWDVEDIMKSSDNAAVILSFNYDNRLAGTIEISMIRSEDGWKIDSLKLPEFDEINW